MDVTERRREIAW